MSSSSSPTSAPVALITGASSGIGRAIAHALAEDGFHLALNGRSPDKLSALTHALGARYPDASLRALVADVSRADEAQRLVRETLEAFGRLDVLVNNAGVACKIGLLQEVSAEDVHRLLDINLKGAIFMMQAALTHAMVAQQSGVILNINSIAGKTAFPYWAVYDASKFGLRAVTEAVADEQRRNGIRVCGIYPGAVDTPIWDALELDHAPDPNGMLCADTIADAVRYILRQPASAHISELTLAPLRPAL
ncbi:MAG: SDR family NAD(P)-dependent oxidoreductase [Vampirovibrionales bacterium]|nr:SDR family NAD(P)-dependent oxidoreductase [Vampirovibrionales bacterium]